jgi:hypothetical protein
MMFDKEEIKPADFNSSEKIRFMLEPKPREFEYYYKKYELALNKYAGKYKRKNYFEDFKQQGALELFILYKQRCESYNFQPELNKYKKLLKKAKEKKLIDDFTMGKDYPNKDSLDFLIFGTAYTRWFIKNRLLNYLKELKNQLPPPIEEKQISELAWHIKKRDLLAIDLYEKNYDKFRTDFEDKIIDSVDIFNVLKSSDNPKSKDNPKSSNDSIANISFEAWCMGCSQPHIARMWGISKQAVNKQIRKIIKLIGLENKDLNPYWLSGKPSKKWISYDIDSNTAYIDRHHPKTPDNCIDYLIANACSHGCSKCKRYNKFYKIKHGVTNNWVKIKQRKVALNEPELEKEREGYEAFWGNVESGKIKLYNYETKTYYIKFYKDVKRLNPDIRFSNRYKNYVMNNYGVSL